MRRALTDEERLRVRALMEQRGNFLWPTDASIQLERELNGSLAEARQRVAKLKGREQTGPARRVAQNGSTGRRR